MFETTLGVSFSQDVKKPQRNLRLMSPRGNPLKKSQVLVHCSACLRWFRLAWFRWFTWVRMRGRGSELRHICIAVSIFVVDYMFNIHAAPLCYHLQPQGRFKCNHLNIATWQTVCRMRIQSSFWALIPSLYVIHFFEFSNHLLGKGFITFPCKRNAS